jgi:hypothetical protein
MSDSAILTHKLGNPAKPAKKLGGSGRPRTEHREDDAMRRFLRAVSLAGLSSVILVAGNLAWAQKPGGILRVYLTASPPNMSMLELPTIVVADDVERTFKRRGDLAGARARDVRMGETRPGQTAA